MPCKMFGVATTECSIFTAADPAGRIWSNYCVTVGRVCSSAWWTQRKFCRNQIHRKVLQSKPSHNLQFSSCEYFHLTTEQHRSLYTSLNFHMQHTHATLFSFTTHYVTVGIGIKIKPRIDLQQSTMPRFYYYEARLFSCVTHSAWTAINSQLKMRGQHQSVI